MNQEQNGTLLLRLEGPMQAWGVSSRFSLRETNQFPTKSGVIGLLCAALGRPRGQPVSDLSRLTIVVRVDREGRVLRDFHTTGGGSLPPHFANLHGMKGEYGVSRASGKGRETDISKRWYLSDASFLVGIGGPIGLLETLETALESPRWPLFLGRKSFLPTVPLLPIPALRRNIDPLEVLVEEPLEARFPNERLPTALRLIEETGPDQGYPIQDVPISFRKEDRKFATRYIRERTIPTPVSNNEKFK